MWSGRNTHRARIAASDDLKSLLKEAFEKRRQSHHYLIAHSHGGNVALYSLADKSVSEGLTGIITMGTPFICCRDRGVTEAVGLLKFAVPAFTSALIFLLTLG